MIDLGFQIISKVNLFGSIELQLFILGLNNSLTFVAIFLFLVNFILTQPANQLIEEDRIAKEDGTAGSVDFARLTTRLLQLLNLQLQVASVLMTIVFNGPFLSFLA